MLIELSQGLRAAPGTPQQQFVVVATRCKLLVIERPFETTNFLTVTLEFGEVIFRVTQVAMQNVMVAAPGAQERVVPGDSTDTTVMAAHSFHQLVLLRIPDLQLSCVRTDCEMSTIARPLDACDTIAWANVTKFGDFTVHG